MKRTRRNEGLSPEEKCLTTKGGSSIGLITLTTLIFSSHLSLFPPLILRRSLSPLLSLSLSLSLDRSPRKWSEPKQSSKSLTLNHSHKTRRRKTRRAQEEERNGVEKIEELCSSTSKSTELGIGLLLRSLSTERLLNRQVLTS
jgi:hypothetical protein